MTLLKFVTCLLFSFLILSFFSCGTRKRLPSDTLSRNELSQLFGFKVTNDDNIALYSEAAKWLGVPHRYGGSNRRGVDCSGFVTIIYEKVYRQKLSRSSSDMLKDDCRKISRKKLREGDLVFFRTEPGRKKSPDHAGIYLKNGKFIHTSTSRGVMINSLNEPYYLRTWLTGGRVK